ncbi:MAG TPA: hypothetical protein VK447_16560 [Myxococcaceae bacterium]|nr:hypothetical protein [Myxococcaceae bacterium]
MNQSSSLNPFIQLNAAAMRRAGVPEPVVQAMIKQARSVMGPLAR